MSQYNRYKLLWCLPHQTERQSFVVPEIKIKALSKIDCTFSTVWVDRFGCRDFWTFFSDIYIGIEIHSPLSNDYERSNLHRKRIPDSSLRGVGVLNGTWQYLFRAHDGIWFPECCHHDPNSLEVHQSTHKWYAMIRWEPLPPTMLGLEVSSYKYPKFN